MQSSSSPKKISIPFANSGDKQPIPDVSQIGIVNGRASYPDGFPPLTRTPISAGGVPPYGTDMNGVLFDISNAARWSAAGAPYKYDATFSASIGGYPRGAILSNSVGDGFWQSIVENNTSNPDSGGAGWINALGGRLINTKTFYSSGTYTPTAGMRFILAHMIAGGGASGGTPATSSSQTGGVAAGNSGAYAYIKAYASDIGSGKAISVGVGGSSQVNGAGFAGGTTAIADIADVTGGYGSGPGSVSATTAVAQPSYGKPTINKYNNTEILVSSLGSQAWNFLQSATGSGTGWLSPASPFPGESSVVVGQVFLLTQTRPLRLDWQEMVAQYLFWRIRDESRKLCNH